jgi:4-hydroxysphinganine ceramide fatty acyl 2-hydroxylase
MKRNYVSNSSESVRMFKNDLLESLSKVHFTVPLFVYIPVIGYLCYVAFTKSTVTTVGFIALFAAGLAFWALRIHFIFHGVHHDYPSDAKRLVMPPSASIPMALALFFLFDWILPTTYIYSFFPGFLIGYLVYDISHYAIHHFNFKGGMWKRIKQHHMLHHYQDPSKGYGVSSPVWDKVFGSDFIKKAK